MIEGLLEQLEIPSACKIEKKLYKKQFTQNFSLKADEKKALSNEVKSITLEYLLNKDNINILPFSDEEHEYTEIAFISVELSEIKSVKKIARVIQNIPYQLILFFVYENSFCINISPKRINQNDASKLVVEAEYLTKWIDLTKLSEKEKEFINSLKINKQSFSDFYKFYSDLVSKVIAFTLSEYTGTLKHNLSNRETLDEILELQTKMSEMKNKMKKENNFKDRVNLNIELNKITNRLDELKEA